MALYSLGHLAAAILFTIAALLFQVEGSHFRGGTINWKSEGGKKVHFYYRLAWVYNSGPGCKPSLIGKLVTKFSSMYWTCQRGNCGHKNLHNVNYICTGANPKEHWEQGKNDFTYKFPGTGPFTIGYTDGNWIKLSNGKGNNDWNVATTVDLRTRSDTATPNSSPESLSKPMYYVQLGCEIRLKLPVVDPDDDTVRCRWAKGKECISVCKALPFAQLDEETCTLIFNTTKANSYIKHGIYAVAITIEDFPRIPITLDGKTKKTTGDALSSVPLQFLLTTIPEAGPCNSGPEFVPPTPKENEILTVEEGDTKTIDVYADNRNDTSAKANGITHTGPIGMTQSKVIPDVNRTNTFTTTLTWKTKPSDLGNHIVCVEVINDKGKRGEHRCFFIKVVPKGCKSNPCQNSGKCVANSGNYSCICRPGFTGKNCGINIDDCVPNPCPVGSHCMDGIATFTCSIVPTVTTQMTTTTTEKNHTGMCPLEYEHCECSIRPGKFRNWMGLSKTARDTLFFSFGLPLGFILSFFTYFCCLRPCEKLCDNDNNARQWRYVKEDGKRMKQWQQAKKR